MDIKNVFIIYNENEFDMEHVVSEIKAEGYKHNFVFGEKIDDRRLITKYLKESEEIWTFGHCEDMRLYKLALSIHGDIWKMG